MSLARDNAVQRWAIAAAAGAAVVASCVLLFRVPDPPAPVPSLAPTADVTFTPGRPDELVIRDLAPLFLPTPLNATPPELQPPLPGRALLQRDTVRLTYGDTLTLPLPSPVEVPARPEDTLSEPAAPLALGLGRTNYRIEALDPKGGHVDVYAAGEAAPVISVPLPPPARPGPAISGWQPIHLFAAIDPMGLVGRISVTRSSGRDEIDRHFQTYLAGSFRLGDRLPPGFYRIVVGP